MLNTTNLVKCLFGDFIAIGGQPESLRPLHNSLYNFGGLNTTELLDLGSSDTFQYLLVTEARYILARRKNMIINMEMKYKNRKLPWKITQIRAQKEFNSIKEENFLSCSSFKIDNLTEK